MPYDTQSVLHVNRMSCAALRRDLAPFIIYPPLSVFTKDELIAAWLERFGAKAVSR